MSETSGAGGTAAATPGAFRSAGDGAQVAELYDTHGRTTFLFFLRKVGDPEMAADLNQELFLRLSKSLQNFEGRCSWRTWLFSIARIVLAEHRSRLYRGLAGRTVLVDASAMLADLSVPVDADEEAESVLLRQRLRDCIRRLSDTARAVILGHYFQGITLRELTARLGLSNPSGSRAVLIGAQRKLRRCLEGGRPS